MKRSTKILLAVIAVLILIQLIRPSKNTGEIYTENHINKLVDVPADVDQILKTSCYDCHSNNTNYPWYTNIQPVGWMMANHVHEGTEELNFSEFKKYPLKKQLHKLEEVGEMVEEKHMPISSYLWMHKEAELSEEQTQKLINWAKESMKNLR
jgi:hypothetical protein